MTDQPTLPPEYRTTIIALLRHALDCPDAPALPDAAASDIAAWCDQQALKLPERGTWFLARLLEEHGEVTLRFDGKRVTCEADDCCASPAWIDGYHGLRALDVREATRRRHVGQGCE